MLFGEDWQEFGYVLLRLLHTNPAAELKAFIAVVASIMDTST